MDRVGLEDRDPLIPPVDALAEAIVLHGALQQPERLDLDLDPLLTFPEHRMILHAMQTARTASAGESWARFYIRWVNECERLRHGLSDVLDYSLIDASWQRWMRTRHDRGNLRPSDPSGHITDFDWWLARLQRVAASRRLVHAAQAIAERAWRGDVDGAHAEAGRIDRSTAVVRIDV